MLHTSTLFDFFFENEQFFRFLYNCSDCKKYKNVDYAHCLDVRFFSFFFQLMMDTRTTRTRTWKIESNIKWQKTKDLNVFWKISFVPSFENCIGNCFGNCFKSSFRSMEAAPGVSSPIVLGNSQAFLLTIFSAIILVIYWKFFW